MTILDKLPMCDSNYVDIADTVALLLSKDRRARPCAHLKIGTAASPQQPTSLSLLLLPLLSLPSKHKQPLSLLHKPVNSPYAPQLTTFPA